MAIPRTGSRAARWLLPIAALLAACAPAARDAAAPARAPVAVATATAPSAARPVPVGAAKPVDAPAAQPARAPAASQPAATAASDRCRSDADCTVKDVGSCCGYQPRCVNRDARPDPAAVRARCAAEGRVGTCGFREVAGCQCVAGRCAALAAPGADVVQ